jgi:hypothetical protein
MSTATDVQRLRTEVGELIARHERTRDVAEFAKYADDPEGFFRDVLRCEPWSKQLEMAAMIRDSARGVVLSANGIGKDWLAARAALWWVFARRGLVILTGPTERQVKQILMREVRKAFARAPELPGELYGLELRVDDSGECGILAFTSDDADRLTGFHHPRLLIVITEGQGVAEDAYEAAAACVTDANNRLFVIGNPTAPTGPFFRIANSDTWRTLRIPASEHPNVVTGRPEIPGAVSREWVEQMAEEYGAGSSIYRARVLAQFPEESIEGLIQRAWLRAANARFTSGELTHRNREVAPPVPVLALDVARFGPDSSVLAVVRGPVVSELISWRGASITQSADRVIEHAKRIQFEPRNYQRRPAIWCDEPGLGGGVIDVLRSKGWQAMAFNGAETARDESRFLNKRAETFWHFRSALENGKVALPPDPVLEEEALAIEWSINPARGLIQILGKDLIRKAIGRSPDRLDAVVIGLAASLGGILEGLVWTSTFEMYE